MSGDTPSRPAIISAVNLLFAVLLAVPALAQAPADSLRAQAPRKALVRSLLLPGWGQYANGRPVKALGFGAAAVVLAGRVVAQQRALGRADRRGASDAELEDLAAGRNTRVLLLLANATLAGIDAYVDAQLADFAVRLGPRVGPGVALLELRWSR
ncbi:MAG: hypothetical protein IT369_09625 [Candidatus Latescibacteria bacterium]|nr:hypothetical protein [Candidatus Latescibacterota bacterium]